ncbi:molybdenum cofactor guanylyltransferase [Domibacillus epiphyticus]|uniref:Probable molybdenum cofactor guanylyltransferase n=1 Tax=Domibacillus epiphyticus TaxID=1714355 RepID=A0A1V2A438_9BACI|nr:molybdenum cofactor guanylyltransferase [Domibacillus epiphyticus]OMP65763.1 molybdenum cofactor guanylyltransferase [Domibacillus epiphyticus]
MTIAGVVLAGGQSSRYGEPKMFEQYNGKPFYQYSVNALAQNHLSPIIISTNELLATAFHDSRATLLIETQFHNGPLFALHNVMSHTPGPEWFFVLSADIPFITADFISEMIELIQPGFQAVVPRQGNKLNPLLALYHCSCLPMMNTLIMENKRSMMALLNQVKFKTIQYDHQERLFTNINSKDDFKKYIGE